jgi:hypothetical protein
MEFLEYRITCDALYLGERPKANIFKPCIKTIPFSQISGAFHWRFGGNNFKAVGYLTGNSDFNQTNYLIYSPRNRNSDISKIPLQVEFLVNVLGKVYVLKNEDSMALLDRFEIVLGGLRSKGFGKCLLSKEGEVNGNEVSRGILNVRIPMEETESFNIKNILRPVYGYLFKPLPNTFTGSYVLSLFEGSELVAPKFFLMPSGGAYG